MSTTVRAELIVPLLSYHTSMRILGPLARADDQVRMSYWL